MRACRTSEKLCPGAGLIEGPAAGMASGTVKTSEIESGITGLYVSVSVRQGHQQARGQVADFGYNAEIDIGFGGVGRRSGPPRYENRGVTGKTCRVAAEV